MLSILHVDLILMLSVAFLNCVTGCHYADPAECHYADSAECHYAECHGAMKTYQTFPQIFLVPISNLHHDLLKN